jgi:cysteine dioxygenase
MKTLDELFDYISKKLDNNKLCDFKLCVKEYSGDDWKKYVSFSEDKYKKNLVKRNDKLEIFIICWNNNQISGIHDHPSNGCILKVLQGELEEHYYNNVNNNVELINVNLCKENSIGYQEGKNGLHRIKNNDNKTISLHIYSPPNYKLSFY